MKIFSHTHLIMNILDKYSIIVFYIFDIIQFMMTSCQQCS